MFDYDHIYKTFRSGRLEAFYEHLYPGLLVYASRQLGEELSYLAEDCVQDAVMDSYNERHRFVNSMAWYSYILKSIFHSSISLLRKHNSRNNYLGSGTIEQCTPDLDVAILEQETLDMLYDAIESLPQKDRAILRMSFVEGLRNADIAKRLDIAEITVKKHKARIMAMLRDKLQLPPLCYCPYYQAITYTSIRYSKYLGAIKHKHILRMSCFKIINTAHHYVVSRHERFNSRA